MNQSSLSDKKLYSVVVILCLAVTLNSCKLSSSVTSPTTTVKTKSVRYLANMISSSSGANPSIIYTDQNGATDSTQVMSLDLTQAMAFGAKANLTCSCDGYYSPVGLKASAAIDLKIYVNDTLKAQSSDLKTDPFDKVTASATCSYTIK